MTVHLPDGTPLELADGATGADAAAAIGPGLAKAALAIKVDDGPMQDLSAPLPDGANIAIVTDRDARRARPDPPRRRARPRHRRAWSSIPA